MKKLKHTLSVLNLILFLSSFTLLSLSGFSSAGNIKLQDIKQLVVSPKHDSVSGNVLQLSEENETENDDDFEAQPMLLPFLLARIQLEYSHYTYLCDQTLTEKAGDPIYLRVCNFRV